MEETAGKRRRGMARLAALYSRVSSKGQSENGSSLATQLQAMRRWASEQGCEVPEQYIINETWPGDELDAPGLAFIRGLIRERRIDTLVVYAYDRLARNRRKQAIILYEAEKAGVGLVSITEPSEGGLIGEFMRDALAFAAELERTKIAERALRGRRSRAVDKGLCSYPLYGFVYKDGLREIEPSQAAIVRMIFSWLVDQRLSIYGIMKRLNEMRVPTPRGGRAWQRSTIHRILSNPAYCGRAYAFRWKKVEPKSRRKTPPKTRKSCKVLRPQSEWIELPGTTPAIVSREMFELAERQLKRNKANAKRNTKHNYLLSGRLYCECGQPMHGDTTRGYRYYRCFGRQKWRARLPCKHSVRGDVLEKLVWDQIKEALENPGLICAELDRIHAAEPTLAERDLAAVIQILAKLDLEERRYLRLYGHQKIDAKKLDDEVDRIKTERQGWLDHKGSIEKRIEAKERLLEQKRTVREYCQRVSENLERLNMSQKRLVLEAMEIAVTIGFDNAVSIRGAIPKVGHVSTPMRKRSGRRNGSP